MKKKSVSAPRLGEVGRGIGVGRGVGVGPTFHPVLVPQADRKADKVAVDGIEGEQEEESLVTKDNFSSYASTLKEGHPHPDALIVSSSLSSIPLPAITYAHMLPAKLIQDKLLSQPQLETLIYTCQSHETKLRSGERAGFFIGDGAGVGKGRQLSGIIVENWKRDRKRAVWLSASADLHLDARRDLDDVGGTDRNRINHFLINGTKTTAITEKQGVLFCTYSLLSSRKGNDKTFVRLEQIVNWVKGSGTAEEFEGCLLFDECHKAKGLVPSGTGKPTNMGLCVELLQARLPNARVVYCSATGVTEPTNMAYMSRLGLWGIGTPFPAGFSVAKRTPGEIDSSLTPFLEAMTKGGVGMMELVAMHLRKNGRYIARTLSYEGCTFMIDDNSVLSADVAVYDQAAALFQRVFLEMSKVMGVEEFCQRFPKSKAKKRGRGGDDEDEDDEDEDEEDEDPEAEDSILSFGTGMSIADPSKAALSLKRYFYGASQRCFRSMCISLKVKRCVELAKKALVDGKSVVIGLQSTGESGLEKSNEDIEAGGGKISPEQVSAPRNTIKNLIQKCLPLPVPIEQMKALLTTVREEYRVKIAGEKKQEAKAQRANQSFLNSAKKTQGKIPVYPLFTSIKKQKNGSGGSSSSSSSSSSAHLNERENPPLNRKPAVTVIDLTASDEDDGEDEKDGMESEDDEDEDEDDDDEEDDDYDDDEDEDEEEDEDDDDDDDDDFIKPRSKQTKRKKAKPSLTKAPTKAPTLSSATKASATSVSTEVEMDEDTAPPQPAPRPSHLLPFLVQVLQEAKGLHRELSRGGPSPEQTSHELFVSSLETRISLFQELESIALPGNALDILIDELGGPNMVAEMTGRKSRLVRDNKKAPWRFAKRTENGGSQKGQNIEERKSFQDGRKRVAIISDAASSGVSLHADRRAKNRDRRVHLTLELAWSADKSIQQLGRSHRSNQTSAPEYHLLISPMGGERRFASAVAKRLESLGALTQGDRHGTVASRGSISEFNFDTPMGSIALKTMMRSLAGRERIIESVKYPELEVNDKRALLELYDERFPEDTVMETVWIPCSSITAVDREQLDKIKSDALAFVANANRNNGQNTNEIRLKYDVDIKIREDLRKSPLMHRLTTETQELMTRVRSIFRDESSSSVAAALTRFDRSLDQTVGFFTAYAAAEEVQMLGVSESSRINCLQVQVAGWRTAADMTFQRVSKLWFSQVGIDIGNEKDMKTFSVASFLNRLLGMQAKAQNHLFELFNDTFLAVLSNARRNGTLDLGIKSISGPKVFQVGEPKLAWESEDKKSRVSLYSFAQDRGVTFLEAEGIVAEQTIEQYSAASKDIRGELSFCRTKNAFQGMHYVVLACEKPQVLAVKLNANLLIYRPRTGMSEISRADFHAKYEKISQREAKPLWETNWGTAPSGSTKSAAEARSISHYLLVGDLLPVWQDVDQTYASMHEEGRDRLTVRLGRVTAGGGKRGLGGAADAAGASPGASAGGGAGGGAAIGRVKDSGSTTAGESDDDDEQEMQTETESESEGVGKRQRQRQRQDQTDQVFPSQPQGPGGDTTKADAPRAAPLTGVYLHSSHMSNVVRKLANKNRDDAAAILRKQEQIEAARALQAQKMAQALERQQAQALAQAKARAAAAAVAAAEIFDDLG